MEPDLRSSTLPEATLDSTYMYEDLADDMLIEKYIYEYDGNHIMKRWCTGYSLDWELYRVKSHYNYGPVKNFWIERIDSTFEQSRYTTKDKITRTYNEKDFLIDYREYTSQYNSPWGDARQIYSAVGFDENNLPILYMDTVYVAKEGSDLMTPVIHRWAITYKSNAVESMACYVEVEKEWIPEVKYVITYDESGSGRTIDAFVKKDDTWSDEKISQAIHTFDSRNNLVEYKTIDQDQAGEFVKSFRYEHFYAGSATHNEQINNLDAPEIRLDNSSRTLTVNLKDSSKGEVMLFTASGHIVLKRSVDQPASQISLASLKAGYYIVCVRTSGQSKSQAIVIQ